jgi:fibrillarin-like rRNA methylase
MESSVLQARILALNASYFLKNGGHFVISIKVLLSFLSPES